MPSRLDHLTAANVLQRMSEEPKNQHNAGKLKHLAVLHRIAARLPSKQPKPGSRPFFLVPKE